MGFAPSRALSRPGGCLLYAPGEHPGGGWEQDAAGAFTARMGARDTPFPCVFGVNATRSGTLRVAFVPAGQDRLSHLAAALAAFVDVAHSYGRRTSLVVLFEPDGAVRTLAEHRDHFWSLLGGLLDTDDRPWPDGISTDPEDPRWEFSFRGMPLFVVASTPAHRRRRSRHFPYFAVTFQPRFVFDDLGADTPAGRRAREVIRGRLAAYDAVPAAGVLASFGEPGCREWLQYFLDDDDDPVPPAARCPLHGPDRQETPVTTSFNELPVPSLPGDLRGLLPDQGSLELQRDRPGKVHDWHRHSLDEELFVLDGEVTLFWVGDDGRYDARTCSAGTWITLPAGTPHGSVAGRTGAVYVIRPEGGATATTTWLDPADWPAPAGPAPRPES